MNTINDINVDVYQEQESSGSFCLLIVGIIFAVLIVVVYFANNVQHLKFHNGLFVATINGTDDVSIVIVAKEDDVKSNDKINVSLFFYSKEKQVYIASILRYSVQVKLLMQVCAGGAKQKSFDKGIIEHLNDNFTKNTLLKVYSEEINIEDLSEDNVNILSDGSCIDANVLKNEIKELNSPEKWLEVIKGESNVKVNLEDKALDYLCEKCDVNAEIVKSFIKGAKALISGVNSAKSVANSVLGFFLGF